MDRALRPRRRVGVEAVVPEVDGGKVPSRSWLGDPVRVQADIFADGHGLLGARLLFRRGDDSEWREAGMRLIENDRWGGEFGVEECGGYVDTIMGWVDAYGTWAADLAKRAKAGAEISADALRGVELLQSAADRAKGADREELTYAAERLRELSRGNTKAAVEFSQRGELAGLARRNRDHSQETTYERELAVFL